MITIWISIVLSVAALTALMSLGWKHSRSLQPCRCKATGRKRTPCDPRKR